jgi:hypothetical protein
MNKAKQNRNEKTTAVDGFGPRFLHGEGLVTDAVMHCVCDPQMRMVCYEMVVVGRSGWVAMARAFVCVAV